MKTIVYLIVCCQLIIAGCKSESFTEHKVELPAMDLEQIKERGKIIAVTDYNTANYFIYKGRPMGYQFELLEDFANHIGLQLEIKVQDDFNKKKDMLAHQECDIIALNSVVDTLGLNGNVVFTEPHSFSRNVLIQRKHSKRNKHGFISSIHELAGKTVYLPEYSSAYPLVKNIIDELGDTIYVRQVEEKPETLIKWVSSGKIDYTICLENEVLINKMFYSNIDNGLIVGEKQQLAWMIRSNSTKLEEFINDWFRDYKTTWKYGVLFKRYFINGNITQIASSDYSTFKEGKMSRYDHAIKKYSEDIGWDWKLLASLIYQESRFKPQAKSWAGAIGIMQLMPNTAKKFGVDTTSAPEDHIRAGVKFLKWLDKRFEKEIPDKEERIKFILASYNVGYGHVQDARRLAAKNNADPNIWSNNVELYLLKKSKPEYYKDEVVKYGYCRGTETYNYVIQIIERYKHYINLYVEN